jgi:hypothetical protein
MRVGDRRLAPAALLTGKTRRLGGSQGRSGRVRKISGFDNRTVRPVASLYTDWAIPTPIVYVVCVCRFKNWKYKIEQKRNEQIIE